MKHHSVPRKRKRGMMIVSTTIILLGIASLSAFAIWIRTPSTLMSPLASDMSVNQRSQYTTTLLNALEQASLHVREDHTASMSSTRIILESGIEVYFSQTKPLDEQIASLQLILNRLTIEGKRVSRVDFRFNNPVVQ
jgi:hypothetical protein